MRAAENGLRRRSKDEETLKDEQIKKLNQKIRELVVENDVLREALKKTLWPGLCPTREYHSTGHLQTPGLSDALRLTVSVASPYSKTKCTTTS